MTPKYTYGRIPVEEIDYYRNGYIVDLSGALIEITGVASHGDRFTVVGRNAAGPVQPMTFRRGEEVRIALPNHPRPELDGVDLLAVAESLRRKND